MFALAMALFLMGLAALVIDISFLYARSTKAQAVAQVAAQSGANEVDPNSLYNPDSTGIKLSSTAASDCNTLVQTLLNKPYDNASCRVTGSKHNVMHVYVTWKVTLPLSLFAIDATVRGCFDAAPVRGSNTPDRGATSLPPAIDQCPNP